MSPVCDGQLSFAHGKDTVLTQTGKKVSDFSKKY